MLRIVDLMLGDLRHRLAERQLQLELTDTARQAVVDNSYDVSFGARPMRRYLQQKVETLLAKHIVAGDPAPGTVLRVDYQNGSFVLI